MTTALAPEVRAVLERSQFADGVLRLPAQMDRPLYESVNKALASLGGKWNRKQRGHLFSGAAAGKLSAMLHTGVVPPKNPDAFFPTPSMVVDRMLDLARMADLPKRRQPLMLEPSAGDGAIAKAVQRDYGRYEIHCVESNTERAMELTAAGFPYVWNEDFLTWEPGANRYDRIIMNPPFRVDGDATAWMTHVARALTLLDPFGILVCVVPSGFMYRVDKKHAAFREGLASGAHYDALDAKAFAKSGTTVNAGLLVVPGRQR